MPKYTVTYPIAGSITVWGVIADSEEEAIDNGIEQGCNLLESLGIGNEDLGSVNELEIYINMTDGNVYHYDLNNAFAKILKND